MNFWPPQMVPQPKIRTHLLRDEGEVIVDEVAHHWIAYTKAMMWGALGVLLLVATLFVNADVSLVVLLLGTAALAWAAYLALDVHLDRFVVTNMRVFRVHGVFSQTLATVPLSRILDITVSKPLLGRILGYGNFVFESAAQEQGLREIRLVGRPDQRDLTIQRVVQRAGLRKRA
jgi:PH (Pleckstrin Homology) domain-containing protein